MSEKKQSLTIIAPKKDYRVDALLDSGASTSFIDIELAKELGIPLFERFKEKVTLANGQEVIAYEVTFQIKIGRRVKSINALATETDDKFVIGHDFMQDDNIILDFRNEKIKFDKKIPLRNRRIRF
jgi:predicted aspartyl protease